ncbi:zinc finger protein 431-like isoform X2 [Contarinia nasturtii]|uniref:zinc finger protein 431-like isoform X2 n=1 Tax=Contarinia nasturtii TaxID=265458 RepID=UPI0012D49672|nr:zinc finger protein 431-like isoform X2 [Contarinia nasturtii]
MFSFCRLCAKQTEATALATELSEIESKLKLCCGWKPSENEIEMPNKACDLCVEKLQQCWNFAESIWEAEKQLIEMANEIKAQKSVDPLLHVEGDSTVPGCVSAEFDKEEEHHFDDELFTETESDSESSIENYETPPKNMAKKLKPTCFAFLAAIADDDQLSDGTIRPSALVKLEEQFPEMKTMTWNDCQYICKICDKVMKSPQNFWAHHRSIHPMETKTMDCFCFYCDYTHKLEHRISHHMAVQHFPHLKYRCYYCSDYFWDNHKQIQHQRMHVVVYKCELCDQTYSKHSLHAHVLQKHLKMKSIETVSDPKFICDICEKTFRTKGNIRLHMVNTHSKKLDFICDQCGNKFAALGTLQQHIQRIHNDEKSFECEECGKRYSEKYDFKKHYNNHFEVKGPVECTICKKKCQKTYIKRHMRMHNTEANYSSS